MKKISLFIILMLLFLIHIPSFSLLAQKIISDAPFELKDGKILSDRIVVCFYEQVVKLTKEQYFTSLTNIKDNYHLLKSCLDQYCRSQAITSDQVYIGRAIKRAEPGDINSLATIRPMSG